MRYIRYDWESVDWLKDDDLIALESGRSVLHVLSMRKRLAPDSIRRIKRWRKYDWDSVDWDKGDMAIAAELGADRKHVSIVRHKLSPATAIQYLGTAFQARVNSEGVKVARARALKNYRTNGGVTGCQVGHANLTTPVAPADGDLGAFLAEFAGDYHPRPYTRARGNGKTLTQDEEMLGWAVALALNCPRLPSQMIWKRPQTACTTRASA